ncbi:hypothetical protein [Nocardia sp. NPDC051981]|uniref:hypothetical protein n=1 Tax=Nocardia sp. NPDC051981 TaxID=3155417 RepID=UPI003413911C
MWPADLTGDGHQWHRVHLRVRDRGDQETRAPWLENWIGDHTRVALDNQASLGYIQNPVLGSITPDGRVDAVVEELFPMAAMSDPHAYWGSGGDDAELERRMLDSIARVGADRDLGVIPTSRYVYSLR